MPVYVLAQLSFRDRSRYDAYRAGFMPTIAGTGGRVLAADESPVVAEGDWSGDKVVLLEFPDEPAYERWATSPEYQAISVDRRAGATGPVLLVHGLPARRPPFSDEYEACIECGFTGRVGDAERVGAAIVRMVGETAPTLLDGPAEVVRTRPAPGTWSPLEYACHLRDVLLVQRERALLAQRVDTPMCEPLGRDERVEQDGYSEQALTDVARQLADAAALFANVLHRLDGAGWERTVVYTYPALAVRSLRWLAVHTLHEVQHHRHDINRQLGRF